ncbi:MAG TPA: sigma-70 family RNA polymerase sigma factor [Candidatus Acidoferrum sp.]|jgi:RNA polymerase sigma-70 factor (ECF subfamily)
MSSQSLSLTLRDSWKKLSRVKTAGEEPALVPSNETLIALVQTGDHKAFEELFDRFYVTVRGIARGVLRSSDEVADVVQEAFLDIFQNARSFDPSRGRAKTWICCLAYHRSLKRLRVLKSKEWQSAQEVDVTNSLEADFRPEHLIHSLDFRRCLETVLGSLNEKQRRTMQLHFFEGLELSVVAERTGETLGNTRHHLYRGLQKLRRELVQNRLLAGYIEFEPGNGKGKVRR